MNFASPYPQPIQTPDLEEADNFQLKVLGDKIVEIYAWCMGVWKSYFTIQKNFLY